MGRGVMTSSNAVTVVYIQLDEVDHEMWDCFLDNVRDCVCQKWQSFYQDETWPSNEEHQILRNGHANIIVCQYGDIASVNLVPRDDLWQFEEGREALAENWCHQIVTSFHREFDKCFPTLAKQGTMSNGVSVYNRNSNKEQDL